MRYMPSLLTLVLVGLAHVAIAAEGWEPPPRQVEAERGADSLVRGYERVVLDRALALEDKRCDRDEGRRF